MHIAICGNIGSGKTTLAGMLSKHYNWKAELESVENNPYLVDFYKDMHKWAFHLQVYFLNSRFTQIKNIQASEISTIQDRTIYEDAYIFAANLFKSGFLNNRDYSSYLSLFHSMIHHVQAPDLVIYLKADIPKLVKQIQMRERDYEDAIRLDYLKNLNDRYTEWIDNYDLGRLLIIDVNNLDYVANIEDFSEVVSRIDVELNGLFSNMNQQTK